MAVSSLVPAASGPTLAEITTAIQTNASPYGGTWTTVSTTSISTSASTVTVSGLGSYKYLYIHMWAQSAEAPSIYQVRLNSDSGTNYSYILNSILQSSQGGVGSVRASNTTSLSIFNAGAYVQANQKAMAALTISNNNSSSHKIIKGNVGLQDNNGYPVNAIVDGLYKSASVVSSITLSLNTGVFGGGGEIVILGAN